MYYENELDKSQNKQNHERIQSISATMSMAILDNTPSTPKKFQFEIKTDLTSFLERIDDGLKVIKDIREKLVNFEPEIFTPEALNGIDRLSRKNSGLQKVALESILGLSQNKSIKDLVGINDKTTQALYKACHEIYNEGRYKEAAAAFSILTILDPANHDAWIALGNAEYFCQRYKSALIAYTMAIQAEPNNPRSHFYAAFCYEALKQYVNALNSLDLALFVIGSNSDFKELAQKAIEHQKHLHHLIEN